MSKEKILITCPCDEFLVEGLKNLRYEVEYSPEITLEKVHEKLPTLSGIIIATRVGLNKQDLEKASQLKFIARAGSGLDHVDVQFAESRGIKCITAPEGNRDGVGEHAVGLMLAAFHKIVETANEVSNGKFPTPEFRSMELKGNTIGIIGFGNTGEATTKRLAGFDVRVLAFDKYRTGFGNAQVEECSLDKILDEASVISFHVPLTSETKYFADEKFFLQWRNPSLLVNTSRGAVVKSSALLHAIDSGKLKMATLDVLENENPPAMNEEEKKIFSRLISHPKIIITPHIAGKTNHSMRRFAEIILKRIAEIQ